MHRLYAVLFFCILACCTASSQWLVTSLLDLPDDDLSDAIFAPKTLRAAIENANKAGVATSINIAPTLEFDTILITSGLPVCNVPVAFDGKGIVLRPAAGSSATYGLWFSGKGSTIKDVQIRGFNGSGLVWQASDGKIERVIIRDNNGPGINMNRASRNIIGGDLRGYYSNYIYGNYGTGGNGIAIISESESNRIQFTAIGMNESYQARGNSRNGIYIESVGQTIVNNLISGNEYDGIAIDGDGQFMATLIEKNLIGTTEQGADTMPNLGNGISVFNSMLDDIRDNVVSGNKGNGIYVADTKSESVTIEHNTVGLNRSQTVALPNGVGIRVNGENHFVVNNTVAGNRGAGISTSAWNTQIVGNFIGLDSTQKRILGNGTHGIYANNVDGIIIGSPGFVEPNIIAGNGQHGITYVGSKAKSSIITGNVIGTDSEFKLVAPNAGSGVFLTHDVSDIRVDDNVISYSGKHGVEIERNVVMFLDTTRPSIYQRPFNIHVSRNLIGMALTRADSAGAIGGSGVSVLNAEDIYIEDNAILACAQDGIRIANDSTHTVSITQNDIGDYSGNGAVKGHGIHVIDASNVTIGAAIDPDTTLYNSIVNCGGFAIRASEGTRLMNVYQNETCDNIEGGIELDNSDFYYTFFSNDNGDGDEGANQLQNTPDLAYGRLSGGSVRIRGWLEGRPGQQYRIDVYLDRGHAPGQGDLNQGCIPTGSFLANAGWRGVVRIDQMWANDITRQYGDAFPFVTLTATGGEGTSQFSLPPFTIPPDDTADGGIDVAVYIDTTRSGIDSTGTVHLYATIENVGFDLAQNVILHDSLLGAFAVDSATVTRGSVDIIPDMVRVTIPTLAIDERVEYHAVGRSTVFGEHKRSLFVTSTGIDLRPRNNYDSTLLESTVVNSVADADINGLTIQAHEGVLRVHSDLGSVALEVSDLNGNSIAQSLGTFHVHDLARGVYAVRIISENGLVVRRVVLIH